jgi:hypothetical protein
MTAREQRLLAGCVAVVLISGTTVLAKEYLNRSSAVEKQIATLQAEKKEADSWLADRAFQDKRRDWLDKHLPSTTSVLRAQGELVEELQNAVLDLGLKMSRPPQLNDATKTPHYQEVTVSLSVSGDQAITLDWLATLQSPERFQIIKNLEIDPDNRSQAKTQQANTTLTIARWFKPEGS